MKRVVFLLLVATTLFTISSTGFAQPVLEIVGGNIVALDTLYRGQIVERVVTLRNAGNQTLLIGEILTSCGCTGTVVSTDRLTPGSTGSLKVTLNAKSFSGPVKKAVTVKSNDPAHPATVIELTGFVVQQFEVDPQSFWFKNAEVGRPTSASVTLRNAGKVPVKLLKFSTALEGLTVTLPTDDVLPGKQVTITATLKAVKEMSVISDGVHIATTSSAQPEVYIPVFGTARAFRFE